MSDMPFTLLIADDEAMILRGLANSIPWETIGVTVVAKETDGEAALRALEALKPDIAIVDICMPHCDGLSMIEKALERGIETAFIILSGYEDFAYAQRAILLGVTAYLLKPINKQELMNTVKKEMDKRLKIIDSRAVHPGEEHSHGNEEGLLGQLIGDIAGGRQSDVREVRNLLKALSSPLAFEDVCVIVVDCPVNAHEMALGILAEVFFNCPNVVFRKEATQFYLAVHAAQSAGAADNLKKLLREYIASLRKEGITVVAALGTYAPTLMQLPLSLRDAVNALPYRLYELPDGIYDASAIDHTPLQEGYTRRLNTVELAEAALMGSEGEIRAQIDLFMQSLFYVAMPPPSYIMGMCSYLIMDVKQRLLPFLKEDASQPPADVYAQLHAQLSLNALRGWLYNTVWGFAKDIAAGGIYKHAPIVEKAKAYIEQNLLQKLLLSDVARHVHLSESYLAALFKNYTGQSFRDYLLIRKMEKAKELLLMEHRSIADVSDLLGYEDYRAFTRAFKKQTGLRPSQVYRHPTDEGQKKK